MADAEPQKIIRVTVVDDVVQPGDHVSSHHLRPFLMRVIDNPYTGRPESARGRFLLWAILPVVTAAITLAVIIALRLAA